MKGPGPDYDKCHTLNHMFLLKLSDRPKEDLWDCGMFVFFPPASAWMCPGTLGTNSSTAGLLRELHLPSLGMPKWLWRCNSLVLGTEQCSSYCYGKSMWLSWRVARPGFSWGTALIYAGCPSMSRGKKKKKNHTDHTMLVVLNRQGQRQHKTTAWSQCRWVCD